MTPDQFTALVALTSLRQTPALDCARRVMLDGIRPSVAADEAGVTRQQVSQTVVKLRKALELARKVSGAP